MQRLLRRRERAARFGDRAGCAFCGGVASDALGSQQGDRHTSGVDLLIEGNLVRELESAGGAVGEGALGRGRRARLGDGRA